MGHQAIWIVQHWFILEVLTIFPILYKCFITSAVKVGQRLVVVLLSDTTKQALIECSHQPVDRSLVHDEFHLFHLGLELCDGDGSAVLGVTD